MERVIVFGFSFFSNPKMYNSSTQEKRYENYRFYKYIYKHKAIFKMAAIYNKKKEREV